MTSAPRLWPRGLVACVAPGPSLVREDIERLRAKADGMIAINDAYQIAPEADVLYSSDWPWWSKRRGAPSFEGLKFGIEPRRNAGPGEMRRWQDVQILRNLGDRGISVDPTGLMTGRNSGAAALNLAVLFGASRVVLLGYDMGNHDGKAHFYEHPGQLPNSPYQLFMRMFETMVEPLRQAGVEVLNCTRITRLDCFPRVTLDHVCQAREAVA